MAIHIEILSLKLSASTVSYGQPTLHFCTRFGLGRIANIDRRQPVFKWRSCCQTIGNSKVPKTEQWRERDSGSNLWPLEQYQGIRWNISADFKKLWLYKDWDSIVFYVFYVAVGISKNVKVSKRQFIESESKLLKFSEACSARNYKDSSELRVGIDTFISR